MFEKVNPSHPDKMADRIAGAMVDLAYSREENPKVAVEVLLGHGYCYIIAESSVRFTYQDVYPIVERIVGRSLVIRLLSIPQDKHLAHNQEGAVRCGDNGIFKGCAPTHEQKLLTAIAASIYDRRPYDGKYIIKQNGNCEGEPYSLTICQSHTIDKFDRPEITNMLEQLYHINGNIIINPLGDWTGGPDTDSGATNRKLGSDMGDGVTGGGLHGKDLSKADVSVNIWCYLASIRTGHEVMTCCSIGDESVCGVPYAEIVEQARLYIQSIGGFEKFAEWGLIRPENA